MERRSFRAPWPAAEAAGRVSAGSFLLTGKEIAVRIGYPSLRVDHANRLHHLWCNNGTWWIHYTVHFDGRKRRIRRSLRTSHEDVAVRRRDEVLERLAREGEAVPERGGRPAGQPHGPDPTLPVAPAQDLHSTTVTRRVLPRRPDDRPPCWSFEPGRAGLAGVAREGGGG